MQHIIVILLMSSPLLSVALLVRWIRTERHNEPTNLRINLGISALIAGIPLAVIYGFAFTQIDDNSYYATAIDTILDETTSALEAG
jgi:hypothetical protein